MSQQTDVSTAHETPMKAAEPQPEHRWLHKLIGDWTYEYRRSNRSRP